MSLEKLTIFTDFAKQGAGQQNNKVAVAYSGISASAVFCKIKTSTESSINAGEAKTKFFKSKELIARNFIQEIYYNNHINEGLRLLEEKKYNEAIAEFNEAIKIDPQIAMAYIYIGRAYIGKEEEDKAISALKKALDLDQGNTMARVWLGFAYYMQGSVYIENGEYKKAVVALKLAVSFDPNLAQAYCQLGMAYQLLDKNQNAIDAYSAAIALNPEYIIAHNNLAVIYSSIGLAFEAVREYEIVVKLDPKDSDSRWVLVNARFQLASCYREKGKYGLAIVQYKKVLEVDSNNSFALINLGYTYADNGQPYEAVKIFRKAVTLDPKDAEMHYNLSRAYYHTNQFALAVRHCAKAIALKYKPENNSEKIIFNKFIKLLLDKINASEIKEDFNSIKILKEYLKKY